MREPWGQCLSVPERSSDAARPVWWIRWVDGVLFGSAVGLAIVFGFASLAVAQAAGGGGDVRMRSVPPRVITAGVRTALAPPARLADSLAALAPQTLPRSGAPQAPLVIEEFSDYQCPACAVHQQYGARVFEEYAALGYLRVIHYDLPLPFHPNAMDAAMVAHCVVAQGAPYGRVRDAVFASQRLWQDESSPWTAFAQVLGPITPDSARARACYEEGPFLPLLNYGLREARRRGVSATPTFFIAGREVQGALAPERLRALLDDLLGFAPVTPPSVPRWKTAPPPGR